MRCDECLTLLDQYIEDELDEVTARSLAAHMTTCGECAAAHGALRHEQEIYANYLSEVEPSPHLWANLRLELESERVIRASQPRLQRLLGTVFGDSHLTPKLATTLVLITMGLAIGIMVWRTTTEKSRPPAQHPKVVGVQPSSEPNREGAHREADKTDRQRAANDNERKTQPSSTGSGEKGSGIYVSRSSRRRIERLRAVPTIDQVARGTEQQYLSAIEILSRDIQRRRATISPALLSQLERALTEVDRNIAATRRVAREQPRDPVAVQYLASAYEKKVELLREVTSW